MTKGIQGFFAHARISVAHKGDSPIQAGYYPREGLGAVPPCDTREIIKAAALAFAGVASDTRLYDREDRFELKGWLLGGGEYLRYSGFGPVAAGPSSSSCEEAEEVSPDVIDEGHEGAESDVDRDHSSVRI